MVALDAVTDMVTAAARGLDAAMSPFVRRHLAVLVRHPQNHPTRPMIEIPAMPETTKAKITSPAHPAALLAF
jgi:hypothetical protein